ncbi:hypothetical protein T03_6034 [Trichinella britovi]|uniref:Integrase zinc-binding domain-containing protein n=1 Tax=Trichinella britovi TaxID=45882 RepID=A0A0V1C5C0_TRIBR|nr:hypothetical protein T03_6034 [Trichinella britovi]
MYLQVALRVEDRDACVSCGATAYRTPVRVYCLTRVCFGLACSPYLAMNVIKAHAEQNPEECDDIIKVPVFLRKGGFLLRKWASNRVDLLATLPRPEVCETGERELSKALYYLQLHVDVNQTLVGIRSKFWILKGRNAVRKVIRSCPVCRRVDAQPYRLRMGNLPADRVTESLPFSHTGVDFAGSLFVRPEVKRSDTQVHKANICIFTCMTTRAVHLELLKEQTTDSFLQGLRRFKFRSFNLVDQFIQCLFRDSNWKRLQHKLNQEQIRWKFVTPRALWCSGYWERLIPSIKNALRKTLRGALLTHDELHTTICEIEARINDRPIVLTGDNPSDRIA